LSGICSRKASARAQSDELFIALTGQLETDLRATDETISTHILQPNQMLAVHAGFEHRARSKGLTTLIVLDTVERWLAVISERTSNVRIGSLAHRLITIRRCVLYIQYTRLYRQAGAMLKLTIIASSMAAALALRACGDSVSGKST
jgi:hypothetical protein